MRRIIVENLNKIKKAVPRAEKRVKIKIGFLNGGVNVAGNELNEYLVEKVLVAVDFGFDVEDV